MGSGYNVTLQGAIEHLDCVGQNQTFITPLGTNHALAGVYHNYYDDTGNIHYGKEWDFMATKRFGKHHTL